MHSLNRKILAGKLSFQRLHSTSLLMPHNTCVCTYHQNVKLMLVAMISSYNYRQIMKLCLCDVDRYDCMIGHCDNCLDLSLLKLFLRNKLLTLIRLSFLRVVFPAGRGVNLTTPPPSLPPPSYFKKNLSNINII